jgi:cyanate permease
LLPGIAVQIGWRGALLLLVPLALLLALLSPRSAPRVAVHKRVSFALRRPSQVLLLLMAVQLCAGVSLSCFITFLGVFATQQGMSSLLAGSMVAAFGVMGVLARVMLTPLGARMRDESLLLCLLLGLAAVAIGVTLQATVDSHWRLWFGTLGMGSTAVATNAIAMSMLLRDPAFGTPAISAGMLSVGFFAGFAIGPPSFGVISQLAGFTAAWSALIGVLGLGCLLSLWLWRTRRRESASQSQGLSRVAAK